MSGTANLAVLAGCIYIDGADSTFNFSQSARPLRAPPRPHRLRRPVRSRGTRRLAEAQEAAYNKAKAGISRTSVRQACEDRAVGTTGRADGTGLEATSIEATSSAGAVAPSPGGACAPTAVRAWSSSRSSCRCSCCLILGLLDFGSAYNVHNNMTQLAGEAVRFAAVNNCGGTAASAGSSSPGASRTPTTAACRRDELRRRHRPGQTAAVRLLLVLDATGASTAAEARRSVTAVVETSYRWLPFLDLGTDIKLSATATMRIEQALTGTPSDAYR